MYKNRAEDSFALNQSKHRNHQRACKKGENVGKPSHVLTGISKTGPNDLKLHRDTLFSKVKEDCKVFQGKRVSEMMQFFYTDLSVY